MSASSQRITRERGSSPDGLTPLHSELSGRREVGDLGAPGGELGDVPDWMGRGAWILSGGLAAAVVLALVVWEPERYANPDAAGTAAEQVGQTAGTGLSPTIVHLAEARVAAGPAVERGGAALPAQAPLREGDELALRAGACLLVEPGMRVCARQPSLVALHSLARQQRVLELHEGRVLARIPAGQAALVLRHGSMRAAAKGGAFAFAAGSDEVEVWVHEGRAEVSRQPESVQVEAGAGAHWSEASGLRTFELTPSQRASFAASARPRRPAAPKRNVAPLQGPAVPGAAGAPSGALPPPGQAPPSQTAGPLVASVQEPEMQAPEVAAPAPKAEPRERPGESEAALALAQANSLRDAKQAEAAESAYAAVMADYSGTNAARRAAVALGDLRLRQRNDPLGALGAYRTFLDDAAPGVLDERARLGVIRALERLNRFAHERKAIEDFISRYPGSAEVPRLQARRTFLGGS